MQGVVSSESGGSYYMLSMVKLLCICGLLVFFLLIQVIVKLHRALARRRRDRRRERHLRHGRGGAWPCCRRDPPDQPAGLDDYYEVSTRRLEL